MVRLADRPSLRDASCCRVEVVKGGKGWRRVCFFWTSATLNCPASIAATAAFALASSERSSLSSFLPSRWVRRARELLAARRQEVDVDGPVFLRLERLDLALALADQAERHRLHAAGRPAARQLAPEHGREREADQVVERAAREIGLDQLAVQVARMADGVEHGVLGDLVEHHALDVDLVEHVLCRAAPRRRATRSPRPRGRGRSPDTGGRRP